MSSGVAAQASEIRKHNSNDAKCVELGSVCIPLVVETYEHGAKRQLELLRSWHPGWQLHAPSLNQSS